MTSEKENEPGLLDRLQQLQTRLDQAEDTLRAWQSGEVDTVVASGPLGDTVYTLKDADKAYRIMVETMNEGALTLTLDGVILFSNQQFASMLERPLERIIGSSIHEFIAVEDTVALFTVLETCPTKKVEVRFKKFPYARVPGLISANRLSFDGIECICLVVTDLSQLRESEERYRLLIESLEDYAILMLDAQGRVASWTSAAEKMEGFTASEVLGQSFERFFTKADVDCGHPQEVLRLAKLKGHFEEDGLRVRRDGSLFWANVTVTALHDYAGTLRGFSTVVRDISARKRIEQELIESEEKFRLLLECAPDAVVVVDENGQLTLVNAQAERLFGYSRLELIGQPIETLIPLPHREAHVNLRLAYHQSSGLQRMGTGRELVALRKGNETFPVEVSLSPIHTPGGVWVAAGIRDITERLEAERHLIAERQRAENANRAKSDFLAVMSHEIRTPMNAILGMADLLWETDLTQIQRDYVGRFRRAGTNLLTLINDILDLSKIESGNFELESVDFTLVDVLGRTSELMAPRAHQNGIEFAVHLMRGTPSVLLGDPLRLQQVLNNIVGNAIKFTEKGSVTLTVRPHADNRSGHLQFSVSDTGIGIPPHKLSSIFDDFSQAESSTTRRFGGTGLGLGICRRLITRMGGNLTVESSYGTGSTFHFDVILALPEKPIESDTAELSDFTGCRVLVVDDDPTNRLILRRTCSAWGMLAIEADTAAKAAVLIREALADRAPFSLVLLDDLMPVLNGFEALKQILAIDPSLPVVLTSSHNEPGSLTKAKALGASAYVPKPIRRAELLTVVSAILRRSRKRENDPRLPAPIQPAAQTKIVPLRILIADDSEDNRFLLAAYLETFSHQLTFVENGQEALDVFARQPFDLVLMDIHMPVLDGLAAAASIRALERERSAHPVGIVALTADALAEDVARSQAAGCNTHLSKPISKEKLLAAMESFYHVRPDC